MATYGEIIYYIKKGDTRRALKAYAAYFNETSGPRILTTGDAVPMRDLDRNFTIWEQIDLYCAEADKRPNNARTWKLLAYAYMWGGLYVPVLLFLAEHCFHSSIARLGDDDVYTNIEEKLEILSLIKSGDEDATSELAAAEISFATPFDDFPHSVPVPNTFYENGIVETDSILIDENSVAEGLTEDIN